MIYQIKKKKHQNLTSTRAPAPDRVAAEGVLEHLIAKQRVNVKEKGHKRKNLQTRKFRSKLRLH